ncbi:hypothetical protein PHYPSEUDO_001603, partial [Phytophthora pseudosyringae]
MFTPLRGQPTFSDKTDAICIGSGRFLRCVLVPTLRAAGSGVVVAQTRGSSFASACAKAEGKYEVDTIQKDGSVQTEVVELEAVGSLGEAEGRAAFLQLPAKLPKLKLIGFGVTEGGIVKGGPAVVDLTELLYNCFTALP